MRQSRRGPLSTQVGGDTLVARDEPSPGGAQASEARESRLDGIERVRIVRAVTTSAAHDLANLLTVMGFELARLGAETLSPKGAEAVCSLRSEIRYLSGLATDLRIAASDADASDPERETHLRAWWSEMRALLLAVYRERVSVRAVVPWGLPVVRIPPSHLTQIILNLVGNAAHATHERPRAAGAPDMGAARCVVDIGVAASEGRDQVVFTVSDTGAGMSPGVLARACEPRFTTRRARGGTGLGLATIHRLVRDAGGSLRLSSAVDVGTTVVVTLPSRGPEASPGTAVAGV